MTATEAEKILEEAVAKVGEHFDAVQILATWNEGGFSMLTTRGCGNWYARQGMARHFISTDIAQDTAVQIAERLNDKPEEGDGWKQNA